MTVTTYTPAYAGRRAVVHERRRFEGVHIVSWHESYDDAAREAERLAREMRRALAARGLCARQEVAA